MSSVIDILREHERSAVRAARDGRGRTARQAQVDAASEWLHPADAAALARSRQTLVLQSLVTNPATPRHIVVKLADHSIPSVSYTACTSLRVPWPVAQPALAARGYALYLSPHCPTHVITEELERRDDPANAYGPPRAVLRHANIPTPVLEHALTQDLPRPAAFARALNALASPAVTQARFEAFADSLPDDLRVQAQQQWAANPSATPAWLDWASRELGEDSLTVGNLLARPDTPTDVVDRLVRSGPMRRTALLHPACSAQTLMWAATGGARMWRADVLQAVALNPNAPLEVLDLIPPNMVGSLLGFVAAHARHGAQAELMLSLYSGWTQSLGALVRVSAAAAS